MKRFCSLFLPVAVMAGPAFATDVPHFGDVRPYVGLEYNYIGADVKTQSYDFDSNTINDFSAEPYEDNYHAIVPNIGVRIGDYFGLEIGYLRSTEEDKNISGTDFLAGTTGKTETRVSGWHIDANGYLPLTEELEAIGSVGLGRYEVDYSVSGTIVAGGFNFGSGTTSDDVSDTALRLGAGLQYGVTEQVSLRGMVRYIDLDIKDAGVKTLDGAWVGSLGVSYSF